MSPSAGVEPQHEGWQFCGRHAVLQRIETWLDEESPGAFVVTGSSGCGKSAVLRHVAARFDGVDASVCLHGMDEQDALAALAARLGLPAPVASWQLVAEITKLERPPVLVLDGLDEAAPEQLDKIATELLIALSMVARVLVATEQREFLLHRPAPGAPRVIGLDEIFGAGVPVVDLDAEPDTRADIERYLGQALNSAGPPELVAQVASEVAGKAPERGAFLYAHTLARQVSRGIIDLGARNWRAQLSTTIGAALDRELCRGIALTRDESDVPGAVRDLLHALAWGLGQGMPRLVWRVVAGALSSDSVRYRSSDLDWVLEHYGDYITVDEQDGTTVYRLSHQEYAQHLLGSPLPVPGSPASVALVEALVARPEAAPPAADGPDERIPYLRRYLARHASIAGTEGVDAVYRLVKDTPEVYLPDLGKIVHQLGSRLAEIGQHETALAPATKAVNIYRLLAAANAKEYLPFLAMALNDVAVYLSELGRHQESISPGTEATEILAVLTDTDAATYLSHLIVSLNNLTGHLAGLDRISDAVDCYTIFITTFADTPAIRDALIVERAGFHIKHGDPGVGLGQLVTLLTLEDAETPQGVMMAARNSLRRHYGQNAAAVKRAWREAAGTEAPEWLELTAEQIATVAQWSMAPCWTQSKSFFQEHAEELLADSAFVALEELELVAPSLAGKHLDLLEEITAVGVEEAYRPYLLEDLVWEWISVQDWRESQTFAERHASELLTTEAEQTLIRLGQPAATVTHLAVLGLALRDGLDVAYGCVTDRKRAAARMRQALVEGEPGTIIQLALLEGRVFGESYAATAHIAVASSLAGETMNDTSKLDELAEQAGLAERQRVAAEITELLVLVPERAARLGALPEILLRHNPR